MMTRIVDVCCIITCNLCRLVPTSQQARATLRAKEGNMVLNNLIFHPH